MTTEKKSEIPKAVPVSMAVVGCGYWGPNLARNIASNEQTHLEAICDANEQQLSKLARIYSGAKTYTSFEELLEDPTIEAVAIATPVRTHATLACAAMEAGKHVLVEKPMAASVEDCQRMLETAERTGRKLVVDHVFVYSPQVTRIKEIIDSGDLGEIYYVDSVRINLGLFQSDVNVLWDLGPHDVSIVDYLLNSAARSVSAVGVAHTASGFENIAYLNMDFGDSLIASFHLNWLSPVKLRHMIIGGSQRSIVYNHLDPVEPIKVYDGGIELGDSLDERRGLLVNYRTGDVWSPQVSREEALDYLMRDFAASIRTGKKSLSDGEAGLRVVRILEAAQCSIKAQGGRITL